MLWLGVSDERLASDGAGDRGRTGSPGEKTEVDGTSTGKVVVESPGGDGDGDRALDWSGLGGEGKTVGRPAVEP
jgi:hypothetical protein